MLIRLRCRIRVAVHFIMTFTSILSTMLCRCRGRNGLFVRASSVSRMIRARRRSSSGSITRESGAGLREDVYELLVSRQRLFRNAGDTLIHRGPVLNLGQAQERSHVPAPALATFKDRKVPLTRAIDITILLGELTLKECHEPAPRVARGQERVGIRKYPTERGLARCLLHEVQHARVGTPAETAADPAHHPVDFGERLAVSSQRLALQEPDAHVEGEDVHAGAGLQQ